MNTPIKDRSDEELNRVIADFTGARYFTEDGGAFYYFILDGIEYRPPTEDLNACHEAENKWCEQDGPMDANHPRYLLGRTLYNVTVPYTEQPFRATARQRAEALVAVIEQQKGEQR